MSERLTKVGIFHFRHILDRPIQTIMGEVTCRPAIILRIEDEEGAYGYGEIWCNFPPDGDLHRARLAYNVLPAALAGLTSDITNEPFDIILGRLKNLAVQAGEPGPLSQIASGADIAIYDLAARRAGLPLAQFLGGKANAVAAYASGISPNMFEQQFERMRAFGYRNFKQRVGFGEDDSLREVDAAVKALLTGETLRIDANQAWDVETAISQSRRLADLGLSWLEEPLPADAPVKDWLCVAGQSKIPLAAGENLRGDAAFKELIECGAVSFIQPDVCKWGGLSGAYRVAKAALAAGHTYCPHFLGGGVGLMASAHLLSAVGGEGVLEVDSSENPMLEILCADGIGLKDGKFPVPAAPGLGYDPDIEQARSMLVSETYCTMET